MSTEPFNIFQPVSTVESPVKLLLPGKSGTGKTVKACQLTDGSGRVALINFDNNTSSLALLDKSDRDLIDIIDPRLYKGKPYPVKDFWKVFIETMSIVMASKAHSTVVLDSTTTFVDELYWSILGERNASKKPAGADGKQGFAFWGEIASHLNIFAQHILHAPDLDKHIVIIAHDAEDKNDLTGEVTTQIIMPGKTQATFPLHFTDIWRTYAKIPVSGPVEYRVRTIPQTGILNKRSLPIPDDFIWDKEKSSVKKYFKNLS